MSETYTDKITRQRAGTTLTPGEKSALSRLRAKLNCANEADTIRTVLRAAMRDAGLLA